jgi:hypothetical protein
MRDDAGLTGRELAAAAGWHAAKISKIEHAVRPPSREDVTAWAEHCGAIDQLPDLLAALQSVQSMYVEFRGRDRSGLRRIQQDRVDQYEQTRLFRIYEPDVVPGLLQTREYAEARLRLIAAFKGLPDDVSEAVDVRMSRQKVLDSKEHRFSVVLEEASLSSRIGSVEMMAAQLAQLMVVGLRPNVSLGIVPAGIDRTMWSSPGFWMFDDNEVTIETPTAALTITQPREIQMYARVFAELSAMAVVGAPARALIVAAIDRLGV